jgi:hypothetical protein
MRKTFMPRSKLLLPIPFAGFALFVMMSTAAAQPAPLLYVETIQAVPGGPLQMTFRDEGTGATNYVAEFADALGSGEGWTVDPAAVITSLGGGEYRVDVADPLEPNGFYRVIALTPSGPVVAQFANTSLQVTEGGTVEAVIQFSAPFTGTLRYRFGGTVDPDDFVPLSGEIQVNNSTRAVLSVEFTDDRSIDELRYLTLRLEGGPGLVIGAAPETRLFLEENDAEWRGTLFTGQASLGFLMRIHEEGQQHEAEVRSEPAGFFPAEPVVASVVFTETEFDSTSAAIPLSADATLFDTPAMAALRLQSVQGVSGQIVSPREIRGEAMVITRYEGKPYLDTTNHGTFYLIRATVSPSTRGLDLVDAQ